MQRHAGKNKYYDPKKVIENLKDIPAYSCKAGESHQEGCPHQERLEFEKRGKQNKKQEQLL